MDEQRADRRDESPILIDWRCSEQFQNSELYPVTDYLERFIDAGREESAAIISSGWRDTWRIAIWGDQK